jgi:hypothetical protein
MQGDATYREPLEFLTAEIVQRLIDVIGKKLTAYIGNVNDVRAVEAWATGGNMCHDVSTRLRFAFQLIQTLGKTESRVVIQAWLMGVNPELTDMALIRLIRGQNIEEVAPDILRAARTFLAEGDRRQLPHSWERNFIT